MYLAIVSIACVNGFSIGQAGNSATVVAPSAFDTRPPPNLLPQTRAQVCPPSKTPIAELQEYCQQNGLKPPQYKDLQVTEGFCCIVTIKDKQWTGGIKTKKQDAKHSAAEVAFQQLCHSSRCIARCGNYSYIVCMQIWPIVVQLQFHL